MSIRVQPFPPSDEEFRACVKAAIEASRPLTKGEDPLTVRTERDLRDALAGIRADFPDGVAAPSRATRHDPRRARDVVVFREQAVSALSERAARPPRALPSRAR